MTAATGDDVPRADAAEQALPAADVTGEVAEPDAPAVGDGVPEADALEQARPAAPAPHRADSAPASLEADHADVAEQSLAVPLDEDEGRE